MAMLLKFVNFAIHSEEVSLLIFRLTYDIDFDLTKIDDPHIVIGAMKMYFREMVPPLIPFELYAHFLRSQEQAR